MKMSLSIVLSLAQFDSSYSSAIITLNSAFIPGSSDSRLKKSHESHSWFVSWDGTYHKSTPSKTHFFLCLFYRTLLTKYWLTAHWLFWLLLLLRFSSNFFSAIFIVLPLAYLHFNVFFKKGLICLVSASYCP